MSGACPLPLAKFLLTGSYEDDRPLETASLCLVNNKTLKQSPGNSCLRSSDSSEDWMALPPAGWLVHVSYNGIERLV